VVDILIVIYKVGMTKRRTKEIEEALPEIVGNSVDINLDTYEAQIIELM